MKNALILSLIIVFGFVTAKAQEKKTDTIKLKEVMISDIKLGSPESGYRYDTAGFGFMGKIYLQNIPFSVNTTSGALIETTESHNLTDALRTNASVIPTVKPNNDERGLSNTYIRGFSPNYALDGLPVNSYHIPPVESAEKIEVLNGLNSFFYGFSSFGGVINFISKAPPVHPTANFSMGIYNGAVYYLKLDAGSPLTKNKKLTCRVNSYLEDGETYIKNQRQNSMNISGSLNYNVFARTNIRLDVYHQNNTITGQQNVFTVNPVKNIMVPSVSDFDQTTLYGQDWTYTKLRYSQIGLSVNSEISKAFTLRAAYRYGDAWWKYNYITSAFNDNNGNFTETDKDFGSNQRYYNAGYAMMDASFKTFGIQHNLTLGYSGNNTLIHFGGNPSASIKLGKYNISAPVYVTMPDTILSLSDERTNYNQYYYHTILLGDHIIFNKYLSAIIGVSECIYKTVRTTGNMTQTGSANYTQYKLSPNIALTYTPIKQLSVYASYTQGLGIGGIAPDAAKNAGEMLKPSSNQQIEGGIKSTLKNLNLAAAYFWIDTKNEYIDPADTIYKQDGREIHQGVELNVTGKIIKSLTVAGGFTFMDANILRATNNPAIEGKTPINIPLIYANLYLEYSIPHVKGLSISANGNFSDKRYVDVANLDYIPEYFLFDAGIHYGVDIMKSKIFFNFNVSNIMDTKYFSSYTTSGLRLGSPRLFSLSIKINI